MRTLRSLYLLFVFNAATAVDSLVVCTKVTIRVSSIVAIQVSSKIASLLLLLDLLAANDNELHLFHLQLMPGTMY